MHRYIIINYCTYASLYIAESSKGGDENMDQVIMPELITPKFAEVIAENPEVLKAITDPQPGEKVVVGQNCGMECGDNTTIVKLVFCNVTIGMDNASDDCNKGRYREKAEEHIEGCHIKIGDRGHEKGHDDWEAISGGYKQTWIEIEILEARKNEIEKIMKLIPRQIFNRKLVARCRKEIHEIEEQLAAKRMEL